MADIRALMAQERQARRINHEFAYYTKPGALMCTACQLNIKSESLWEGHLRSTNHRTNVKKAHQAPRPAIKRKLDDVEESQNEEDIDGRKKLKPKSRGISVRFELPEEKVSIVHAREEEEKAAASTTAQTQTHPDPVILPTTVSAASTRVDVVESAPSTSAGVNEDEWAAFERDVAPLVQPDYSAATISAAPVSAAQLEAEAEKDKRRLKDAEAQDEKEDEERRIEEEFDVMEEMEERVRKLKEKREALRALDQNDHDTGQEEKDQRSITSIAEAIETPTSDEESDDEVDDWYS